MLFLFVESGGEWRRYFSGESDDCDTLVWGNYEHTTHMDITWKTDVGQHFELSLDLRVPILGHAKFSERQHQRSAGHAVHIAHGGTRSTPSSWFFHMSSFEVPLTNHFGSVSALYFQGRL